jgi:hypothetical protein
MSEPSPEAKQAADRIIAYAETFGEMRRFGYKEHLRSISSIIQQAIDAATAKLREENETLKRCLKQMQDEAIALAHQQPSK